MDAVKYEARLEDGSVVSKSEGVEFTVKDGWYYVSHRDYNDVQMKYAEQLNFSGQGFSVQLLPRLSRQ